MTTKDKIIYMLNASYLQSGMTHTQVAEKLGVSRKTIYNWLDGYGCPTLLQTIEWFKAMDMQMMPWIMSLFYMRKETFYCENDAEVQDELIEYIKSISPDGRRKLLYCLKGEHGSSSTGVLEMITAHLHTPLRDRLGIAALIIQNYTVADLSSTIVDPAGPLPDIDILKESLRQGTVAVTSGMQKYTNLKEIENEES